MTNLDNILKSRDITLPAKVRLVKAMVFSVELDYKESWALKNCCFWTVLLEKTLESPLDNKEIQPVHPKGNQSWILIGRTDAEAETPILWPLMQRTDSLEKTLILGKIEGRRRKGTTEDEMVGWLDGITDSMDVESEWIPGVGEGTGRPGVLRFMGSQRVGHDWVTELNWTKLNWNDFFQTT